MMTQYAWARRQRALFPRYAAMVVASDHMRREFERYDGLAGRVTTIPLFTAGPASRPAASDDDAIDVVFLGRLTPLKGADLLMDALEHAAGLLGREVRAVIAGEGPERSSLNTRAAALRAAGKVRAELPGWIDAAARDAVLARTRVLALTSRWPEPFGLVGLEAARFGVPTVAFDVGGIRTWLAADVNGVLVAPAEGAAGFGAALASVLRDASTRERLGAGALAAAGRFSAAAHVTALERVLSTCRPSGTS
jgi:glycosyltransferase involved in cell wall biosynthesis